MEMLVSWQEWSDKPFTLAVREDKPVFLYIRAGWCHLCQRMEEKNFTDPSIVNLINQYFIPVWVNSDDRPDINLRYNMGGWPTLAVLNPEGEVITGSGFLAKEDFKKLLTHVYFLFKNQRQDIQKRLKRLKEASAPHFDKREGDKGGIPADVINQTMVFLKKDFDQNYGGFGREPKFPHYEAIELFLLAFHLYHEDEVKEMLISTLDWMKEGDLFDQEEGGFFRYAQYQDWSSPHHEKMLADNAWLLRNYLHAYLILDEDRYQNISRSILHYLDTYLYDRDRGVFFGSQRADEHYYNLSQQERRSASPPDREKTIYTDWNALTASVYYKASVILHEPIYSLRAKKAIDFLYSHLATEDKGMLHTEYRNPATCTWRWLADQVHMAGALLDSYQILGDESYLSYATKLAEFLHSYFYDEGRGGFWDRMENGVPQGRLKERIKPVSENALAAEFFFKLAALTQKSEYLTVARQTLNFFSQDFFRYGIFASRYALACHLLNQPQLLVVILGRKDETPTQDFLRSIFSIYEPRKIIKLIDITEHQDMATLLSRQGHKSPRGYIYLGQKCLLETDNPQLLVQGLQELSF